MNKVILMGRLTRDPEVRYTQGEKEMAVGRFTLAVDRKARGETDYIPCVAFAKWGEFTEKYLHQGIKIVLEGRIQTGSYTNREGKRVYTTDVVADNIEFAESKAASEKNRQQRQQDAPEPMTGDDGFMNIPDGIDEELPFT